LAVLGVSVLVLGSIWIKAFLFGSGILFLFYMGYVTWNSKNEQNDNQAHLFTARKQATFAASVSLLNPHAILDTIGVIGTSSLSYEGSEKLVFAAACILISWLWFFALAVIGRLTGRIDKTGRILEILNKLSAFIMWGTAILLLFNWIV
jgi:L-lysine exporter family protein LysE/ArgO